MKVQWRVDDNQAAADELNAGASGARQKETSPVVVDPGSSAAIDRLAQAAKELRDDATAKAKTEAFSLDRAARRAAAAQGAIRPRQVLGALDQIKLETKNPALEPGAPDREETVRGEWSQEKLIQTPEEARRIAEELAGDKGSPSE